MLLEEYDLGGIGYRTLAKKYGTSASTISRMIISNKKRHPKPVIDEITTVEVDLPDDLTLLKEEIRQLKLKIELQDIIIDISSKELGVNLRKKRGARQS